MKKDEINKRLFVKIFKFKIQDSNCIFTCSVKFVVIILIDYYLTCKYDSLTEKDYLVIGQIITMH